MRLWYRTGVPDIAAERDREETYRTWLLSSASEPEGQAATGSACYSGRVSDGTCRDYLREKIMKRSGNTTNNRLLIFQGYKKAFFNASKRSGK